MTDISADQINEIRSKVMGTSAKIPSVFIGMGVLLIILGGDRNCWTNPFLIGISKCIGNILICGWRVASNACVSVGRMEDCWHSIAFCCSLHRWCDLRLGISTSCAGGNYSLACCYFLCNRLLAFDVCISASSFRPVVLACNFCVNFSADGNSDNE